MSVKRIFNEAGKRLTVIDDDGVILGELDGNGVIVSGNKKEKDITWLPTEKFTKMFEKGIDSLPDELTLLDFKIIMKLSKYISYSTGQLCVQGHENVTLPLSVNQICVIIGLHQVTVKNSLSRLNNLNVIKKVKTNGQNQLNYYFNPYIFSKGRTITKELLDLFKGWNGI